MKFLKLIGERNGFTLVESMLATVAALVIMGGIARLTSSMIQFSGHSQVHQSADTEARICLDTIEQALANGQANTLAISTPATTPTVPNSQAQFSGLDGSSYTITWSATPLNTVHLLKTPAGGGTTTDSVLATHVNELVFSHDYRDPALVAVTFQMVVPLDSSGRSNNVYTIFRSLPNLRMIAAL